LPDTSIIPYHSRSLDATALSAFFTSHPNVEYAEPNYIVQSTALPDDPGFAQLWGLQNVFQAGADIGAAAAWDVSTGSQANVVAVIDTGMDYSHQDLAANVWSAPSSFTVTIGGTTVTCAAGTHGGHADDHIGRSIGFVNAIRWTTTTTARTRQEPLDRATEDHAHMERLRRREQLHRVAQHDKRRSVLGGGEWHRGHDLSEHRSFERRHVFLRRCREECGWGERRLESGERDSEVGADKGRPFGRPGRVR
jgi:hypothetical protein